MIDLGQLRFHYCVSPKTVLYDPRIGEKLREMRRAGVGTLWLFWYFYGHDTANTEELAQARQRLIREGFEVNALSVPLGHGGNAFDPDNPDMEYGLGDGWRHRMDIDGRTQFNCACISDKLLVDSAAAASVLAELGIDTLFFDDDLRLGHWGPSIQGCYCDACVAAFSAFLNEPLTRADLKDRFAAADSSAVALETLNLWLTFQCEKVVRFLKLVPPKGVTPGIMAMHNADRRHGVDLRLIREQLPNAHIRVGEGHFGDASFIHPQAEDALTASIQTHLALISGTRNAYSESTVFPMHALSPDHWLEKMRLEIRLGLRNLFLMSGTRYFAPEYWDALARALPALEDLAQATPEPPHEERPFVWQI